MSNLKKQIMAVAREAGIDKVGFTSIDCLKSAPPWGDLSYIMHNARAAISLVVALDKLAIRDYLGKKDQAAHVLDHKQCYMKLKNAALIIQSFLNSLGYEVKTPPPNFQVRPDQPFMALIPPVSHRYIAAASGIGWIGWSGNLITEEFGAAIVLSTVVTSAELEPDLPVRKETCSNCHLCAASCPSHFISLEGETKIHIAGLDHVHNKKANNLRCVVTCGGANGVANPDAKWSTWSYKVLDLPVNDDKEFIKGVLEYSKQSGNRLRAILEYIEQSINGWEDYDQRVNEMLLTCGNCMLICWPSIEDRRENYRLLTTSGRVYKDHNGLRVERS